jgi:hypothetical protein
MIEIKLTVNEVNAILLALAKQPYETVAQLIEKVRTQAIPQVPSDESDIKRAKLAKDLEDVVAKDDNVEHFPH